MWGGGTGAEAKESVTPKDFSTPGIVTGSSGVEGIVAPEKDALEKDGVATEKDGEAQERDGVSAASDGKQEKSVSLEGSSAPGAEGLAEKDGVSTASLGADETVSTSGAEGLAVPEKDGPSTASETPGVTMKQLDAALEDSSTFLLVGRDQATASGGVVPTVEEVPAEEIVPAIPV